MTKPFDNISSKNKNKLLKLLEANTLFFKSGSAILNSIKTDNIIGIIKEGNIQIIRCDLDGNITIIEDLIEDDIFGSTISSLTNKEYDIIAKEDTKLIIIDYDEIIKGDFNNKQFYNQFIKNLFEIVIYKIKEKNRRIEILTKKTIRNKLLEYFKSCTNTYNSKYIYLPFTFTDLADYLAVDRSAMSRELKYLKEEGFIEIKGKRITLLY